MLRVGFEAVSWLAVVSQSRVWCWEKCCTPRHLEPSLLASNGLGGLARLCVCLLELYQHSMCLVTANLGPG